MRGLSILILAASLLVGWSGRAQEGLTAGAQQGGMTLRAQEGLTLNGTVEDQAGGVIPGAKLTLTNTATGEVRSAVADDGGNFSFPNLPPGKYSLKGEAKGFEGADLQVTIGEQSPETIKLKLGISLKEEVTIKDDQTEQTLSPQANADAINMTGDFLKALPAQSEDILPILGNFLSTSAQGTEGLSVVVDGVEGAQLNVPTDAIRRVLINRNPYSSAYRRPGEGRVEVLTKDGSRRRYDGSFAYYLRHSLFDARNPFALTKPPLDRRLFSASFGGPVPVWKKATFFVSANNLINNETVVSTSISLAGPLIQNVPTSKHRLNFLGRFDLRPNEVHTLSARYYYYRVGDTNKGVTVPFALPEQGYDSQQSGQRFLFSDRAILSPNLLNDLSITFSRDKVHDGQKSDKPTLVVRGAFIGGPSPVNRASKETILDVQDTVTYTHGNQTVRFGGGFRPRYVNSVNATNFVGTYFFQNIFEFGEKSPFRFIATQGDPAISFSQYEMYGFIEDEIKLRPWFSITPGLRYDWQSNMNDRNNFGPRLSFALAPGKQKTVLRGGAGIFYERLPGAVIEQTFIDGNRTRLVDIPNPSYPDPFRAGRRRAAPKPSVWRLAPDLSAPYIVMGSLSLERRLWGRSQVSVEYQRLHGVHLFRSHNINAQIPPRLIARPNPAFNSINQVESSASSRSSAVKVTFQGRIGKVFRGMAQYTYSHSTDDTSGPLAMPANNYDFGAELGRSSFDQRHRFSYAGTFDLPYAFRLGAVLSLASGLPFDITTGFDDNGDLNPNDRPPDGTRNIGKAPPIQQLDLRVSKLFKFPSPFPHKASKSDRFSRNLEFSIDAFNLFNHPNTPVLVGELGSHIFGQASSANMSRTLQFSVKYSF
jgi:carboxypeptidase family protein